MTLCLPRIRNGEAKLVNTQFKINFYSDYNQ